MSKKRSEKRSNRRAGRLGRLALLCCGLAVAMALGACGTLLGQTPEEVVGASLEELRSPTEETIQAALTPELQARLEELGIGWQDLFEALYGHLSYDGLTATMAGNGAATVELDVTNVDLPSVLETYRDEAAAVARGESDSGGALDAKALLAALTAEDAPTVTTHGSVELERVDGQWQIRDPKSLLNLALDE